MALDLLQLSLEHHRAGRLVDAEAGYRALIEADGSDADALHWLGVLMFQAGRPDEALPRLERAAAIRPDDPAFLHNLAQAYAALGRQDHAIATLEQSASLAGAPGETFMALAMARLGRHGPGDADAAVRAMRSARVAGGAGSAEADHLEGLALLAAGRPADAVGPLRAALARRPDYASAHYYLAVASRQLGQGREVRKQLLKALEIEPGMARAWCDLAALELEEGSPGLAPGLFRRAIAADADFAPAYAGLASALTRLGRPDEARQALARRDERPGRGPRAAAASPAAGSVEALQRKIQGEDASNLHHALSARKTMFTPSRLAAAGVRNLFERYADGFDQHLREKLGYRVPEMILDIARRLLASGQSDLLDLGCGTGLVGALLRPLAASLHGVDLSPAMIEKARERQVYDRLEVADLVEAMRRLPRSFDLIAAADVMIYVGDLAPALQAAADCLRPGGLLVFSVEACGGDRFQLGMRTRRFQHSEPYLRRLASICGFEMIELDPISVRIEAHEPVPGFLVTLRAPGAQ